MKQSKQLTPTNPGQPVRRSRETAADPRPAKPAAQGPSGVTLTMTAPVYDGVAKGDRPPYRNAADGAADGARDGARDRATVKPEIQLDRRKSAETPQPFTELPDQEPRRPRGESGERGEVGEGYVRLRVRVRGEQLSVIDSHLVDGPLAQATSFPGTNAYEVVLGDRLLHAGALPDLGVQRSFGNPAGPELQRGHQLTERDVFEFSARVPAHEVTAETIGDIRVVLHRVKQEARATRLGTEPLARQFERELRPIAEVVGLPESVLPAAIIARGSRTPTV